MGISLDRGLRIAGYRASVFTNALKAYSNTTIAGWLDRTTLFPHRRDGAIVFEECQDRGLIDPVSRKITEAGTTLARSKVAARTPLPNAQGVLDEFLSRIDRLNGDHDAISRVDEVWLFGSMLRAEATVGDVDLAIARSSSDRFDSLDDQLRQAEVLLTGFADAPRHWPMPWDRIDWLFRRAIYGARRHPLLAGAKEGTEDLEALGVPCRLIYDRNRGGRVSDDVLPRHPRSKGRRDTVPPLPVVPALTPTPLQPMDARWITGFGRSGRVSPFDIFRGWTEDCKRLFPSYPSSLRIAAFGDSLGDFPWSPKTLHRRELDGRAAVAIISATEFWGTSVTLRRSIDTTPEGRVLHVTFDDLLLHRSRKRVDQSTLPEMAAAASLILAVDAERILRRAAEEGAPAKVTIRISPSNLPDDMRSGFVEEILLTFAERRIDIEPKDTLSVASVELYVARL